MSNEKSNRELAAACRHLVHGRRTAALATIMADGNDAPHGEPYASLVAVAADYGARPILLLSDLAVHAKNLTADNRASLLFADAEGLESPLTGLRVSLQGTLEAVQDDNLRQRYLHKHEDAADYVDFGDFKFYRMTVARLHLVAGFGVIRWISAADYLFAPDPSLADAELENSVISHMNADHGDALDLLAGGEGEGWRMCGLDAEGIDLIRGGKQRRIAFSEALHHADEIRPTLVAMTQAARAG